MADNVYSLLAGWLRYQRDIGVDGFIFDRGSAVAEILAGIGRSRPYPKPAGGGEGGAVAVAEGNGSVAALGFQTDEKVTGISALSKLAARMKPVDALDAVMFERRKQPVSLAPPVRVNSERRERLAGLYREVMGCGKCPMSSSRAKVVFGAGSADGRLFVLGGAPDAGDDVAGLPFQGEVGALFDSILGKMKLDRKNDVFAAYLQKCKSPDAEFVRGCAEVCRPLLDRQIEIIRPKALLVFGEPAASVLLGGGAGDIERMRSVEHSYMGVPLAVTYGLPLMLKDTSLRRGAWKDMEKVLGIIRGVSI
jgi:DNA polymerase